MGEGLGVVWWKEKTRHVVEKTRYAVETSASLCYELQFASCPSLLTRVVNGSGNLIYHRRHSGSR